MTKPQYIIQCGTPRFKIVIKCDEVELYTLIQQDAPKSADCIIAALRALADSFESNKEIVRIK